MFKSTLVASAIALLAASSAHAEKFTLNMSGAWSIVGQPCNRQVINNFTETNGAGGVLTGGASATVQMPGYIIGAATVQGFLPAGAPITATRTATTGCITFYSHPTGGSVTINAVVQAGAGLSRSRGQTGRGVAQTAVRFTCPLFGWLFGRSVARYTTSPNQPGVISTVPQSASASASGQTSFRTNASAGAIAAGALNSIGDAMQLNSNMGACVNLTLQ